MRTATRKIPAPEPEVVLVDMEEAASGTILPAGVLRKIRVKPVALPYEGEPCFIVDGILFASVEILGRSRLMRGEVRDKHGCRVGGAWIETESALLVS